MLHLLVPILRTLNRYPPAVASRQVEAQGKELRNEFRSELFSTVAKTDNALNQAVVRLQTKRSASISLESLRRELREEFEDKLLRVAAKAEEQLLDTTAKYKSHKTVMALLSAVQAELRGEFEDKLLRVAAKAEEQLLSTTAKYQSRDTIADLLSAIQHELRAEFNAKVSDSAARVVRDLQAQIALQETSSRAAGLNGDIAMRALIGGNQNVSKAVLDLGSTMSVIAEFRMSDTLSAVLSADGRLHNWLTKRALTTAGGGLATASSGGSPAPTVPASVSISGGRMALTVTFPAGVYVIADTLTVTFDPATELGAALVPSLSVVPVYTITYTVVA